MSDLTRIEEVFGEALDREPGEEREAFLRDVCAGDPDFESEVRELLQLHDSAGDFLEDSGFLVSQTELSESAGLLSSLRPADPSQGGLDSVVGGVGRADAPAEAPAESMIGRTVCDRYRLESEIGRGGAGIVYRAHDAIARRHVALKMLHKVDRLRLDSFRNELASHRLLRLPGVVELLDEGIESGHPFLVMPIVEGRPFPGLERNARGPKGTQVSWPDIEPQAMSLLESLARIHWSGVVHGDIKPENVYVDDDRAVTILDLGLSVEPRAAAAQLMDLGIRGTIPYLAPESFSDPEPTFASDVYALGILLYQSLRGEFPHPKESAREMIAAKIEDHPIEPVTHVPEFLQTLIGELLAFDPADRPTDAQEVLDRVRSQGRESTHRIPYLQGDAFESVVRSISERRSIRIFGGRGAGKTRLLEEVERWADEHGICTRRVSADQEDASEWARGVGELLDQGVAILCDGMDALPPGHAGALKELEGRGPCVCTSSTADEGSELLLPLSEEALRGLIEGPDRVLHLQEDAARELWRRTGGIPGLVEREIDAWVRGRIARWEQGLLVTTRESIDLLTSGLWLASPPIGSDAELPEDQARVLAAAHALGTLGAPGLIAAALHADESQIEEALEALEQGEWVVRLAGDRVLCRVVTRQVLRLREGVTHESLALLGSGSEARLQLLQSTGRKEAVPDEALEVARQLYRSGELGRAVAVLHTGLLGARNLDGAPREPDLLELMLSVSFQIGTRASLETCLHEFGRRMHHTPRINDLENLARAAVWGISGNSERAISMLESLTPFRPARLERWRWAAMIVAAGSLPVERHGALVTAAVRWAARQRDSEIRSSVESWLGWFSYRTGDYAAAITHHRHAAATTGQASKRVDSLVSAASAAMEAGRPEEARTIAESALAECRALRNNRLELRAEWLIRVARYRGGVRDAPDWELLRAAGRTPLSIHRALVWLTEGAVAWRAQEHRVAGELASRAAKDWLAQSKPCQAALSRALGIASGVRASETEVQEISRDALECDAPDVTVQILALLALGGARVADGSVRAAIGELESKAYPPGRLDVLSVEEALAVLRDAGARE
ncbi:MAG: serine/threonine protein kinase [Candidatus Eisenbacteria bacterium]|uniref:Serine/threonine protein kinase n=1 Tax=Eiseniibacteriota bacterium TaxID=2212470 RepID=A0A956NGB2_UNCEI|nr:serine/threonine protein kinase [Candidatus Eisenbacteria bacterium]